MSPRPLSQSGSRIPAPLLLARPSRFAGIGQRQARLLLATLALLLFASLFALRAADPAAGTAAEGAGDAMLYAAIADGVRGGGDYYTVAADALRHGGYPLHPFLAFRLPTLAVVGASVPRPVLATMLWALAIVAALAWHARIAPVLGRRPARVAAMLLLVAGMAAPLVPDLAVFHETWTGLLIALSLALRRPGRLVEAIALGLAAALIRETAAPYLILMAVMAWHDREPREALGWLAALAAFAIVLGFHAFAAGRAAGAIDPEPLDLAGLQGIGFAVGALANSSALTALPLSLAAPLVALGAAGWSAWSAPLAARTGATLALYLLLLALVARAGDFYWALLVAPVSLVGLVFAVDGVRDLIAATLDRRRITVTRVSR